MRALTNTHVDRQTLPNTSVSPYFAKNLKPIHRISAITPHTDKHPRLIMALLRAVADRQANGRTGRWTLPNTLSPSFGVDNYQLFYFIMVIIKYIVYMVLIE